MAKRLSATAKGLRGPFKKLTKDLKPPTKKPAKTPSPSTSSTPTKPSKAPQKVPTREEARALPPDERKKIQNVDLGDGRDTYGRFTGYDYHSANKEAQGLADYKAEYKRDVSNKQVEVQLNGHDQVRKYDGLALKEDGTYEGVEVKSGTAPEKYARPNNPQRLFDSQVSAANPARGKLDGQPISVTSVVLIVVK